jgi:ureidoacrylate peracid hydrolase
MADLKFDKEVTALLIIDPYNDFISEGGKIWTRIGRRKGKWLCA